VLEGAIDACADEAAAVAVICHPHPQQQGTMQNKVVTTLARTFAHLGAAAVRFNFRGVGGSAGAFDGADGERDDALAAVAWSRERWPGRRLYLGGFSFGAAVALAIAARVKPSGLVTAALTTWFRLNPSLHGRRHWRSRRGSCCSMAWAISSMADSARSVIRSRSSSPPTSIRQRRVFTCYPS
jgi:alpha-beta hydrolase superfamily lysophospholipase